MRTRIWLTLSRAGVVKMTKEKPTLTPRQRAVALTISVPDGVFDEAPTLDAQLDVPASALAFPAHEPVEVEIWGP